MLTDSFILNRAHKKLGALAQSHTLPISVRLPDGREHAFSPNPSVKIHVHHSKALAALMSPSLDTLAESYIEGWIDLEGDITDIVNQAVNLSKLELAPPSKLARLLPQSRHSKKDDQKSIAYHYDVSNEFYAQWLDPAMVYSCAYYENGDESLELAQQKKIDHILTKIMLKPGEHLLDIGCGWGALAIRAAQQFGANVVGITLSKEQLALAQERVRRAGLSRQIELRLQDYRDVTEVFDKVTSVGMFEHVGLTNLKAYFGIVHDRLKPGGLAMNHGITTTDVDNRDTPFGGGTFIDKYVFPNGELPHISTVLREIERAGLETLDVENLRRHYARTALEWSNRFEAAGKHLKKMVSERTWRIWRVYLPGVSWAFHDNWISLNQVLVCRAGPDGLNPAPMSRGYMYRQR